jgi:hypothetical protein
VSPIAAPNSNAVNNPIDERNWIATMALTSVRKTSLKFRNGPKQSRLRDRVNSNVSGRGQFPGPPGRSRNVFGVLDQDDELHLAPASGASLDVKLPPFPAMVAVSVPSMDYPLPQARLKDNAQSATVG